MKLYRYIVRGADFPLDMLRYDPLLAGQPR